MTEMNMIVVPCHCGSLPECCHPFQPFYSQASVRADWLTDKLRQKYDQLHWRWCLLNKKNTLHLPRPAWESVNIIKMIQKQGFTLISKVSIKEKKSWNVTPPFSFSQKPWKSRWTALQRAASLQLQGIFSDTNRGRLWDWFNTLCVPVCVCSRCMMFHL